MLRRLLRMFGHDLVPWPPKVRHWQHLVALFGRHGVDLVLDVGANTGQYAGYLRTAGYTGRIVSFEPLSDAHEHLQRHAAKDAAWSVAPRLALGDRIGQTDINISAERDMSSILPFTDEAMRFTPSSKPVGTEQVAVTTLDEVWEKYVSADDCAFLKIDTQGYEETILDGARDSLGRLRGLQLELSMVPIYEGEANWRTLVDRMEAAGFVLTYIIPGYYSRHVGRMLQFDGIFFRPQQDG